MRRTGDWFLIAAGAVLLELGGLAATPLLDRDEARFAEASRDMQARGDAVVPYFNGTPRYHKPILPYWLQWASFVIVGGPSESGVRLPSVLAGAALAVAVYELGRTMFSRRAGLWASLLTCSSPLWWVESRLGTADAELGAAVAATFLCLYRAGLPGRRCAWGWGLGAGASLGLATLAKGPVAPAIVALAALASALLGIGRRGQGEAKARRAGALLAGAAAYLMVVLPWTIAAAARTAGDFLREGVLYHFLGRATQSYEGHRMFPGAHTLLLAATCFPWSTLLPQSALLLVRRVREGDDRARFLLGWIIGPLAMFEAAASRLPHYTLPIVPALALAAAWLIADGIEHRAEGGGVRPGRFQRGPALALLGATALAATAIPLLRWLRPEARTSIAAAGPGLLAVLATLGAGGALSFLTLERNPERSLAATLLSWCAALALTGTLILPALPPLQFSRAVARAIAAESPGPEDRVLLVSFSEPSLIFYLRRDLFSSPGQVVEARGKHAVEVLRGGRVPAWIVATEIELAEIESGSGWPVRRTRRLSGINLQKGRREDLCLALAVPPAPAR